MSLKSYRTNDYITVAIDYRRFIPTGRAFLTLANRDLLNKNLRALENATISSIPITAVSSPPPLPPPRRTRGVQGRMEAAERGLIQGDGPGGGVLKGGKNVVLWGMPGRLTQEGLKGFLQNFKLAGTEGGKKEFAKIEGWVFVLPVFAWPLILTFVADLITIRGCQNISYECLRCQRPIDWYGHSI
jgi:hypothetical protein